MRKIKEFLDKFRNIANHKKILQTAAAEVLEEELSIVVLLEAIQPKGKVIYLKISGPAKTEIIIRQKEIIGKINRRLGKEAVAKII